VKNGLPLLIELYTKTVILHLFYPKIPPACIYPTLGYFENVSNSNYAVTCNRTYGSIGSEPGTVVKTYPSGTVIVLFPIIL